MNNPDNKIKTIENKAGKNDRKICACYIWRPANLFRSPTILFVTAAPLAGAAAISLSLSLLPAATSPAWHFSPPLIALFIIPSWFANPFDVAYKDFDFTQTWVRRKIRKKCKSWGSQRHSLACLHAAASLTNLLSNGTILSIAVRSAASFHVTRFRDAEGLGAYARFQNLIRESTGSSREINSLSEYVNLYIMEKKAKIRFSFTGSVNIYTGN